MNIKLFLRNSDCLSIKFGSEVGKVSVLQYKSQFSSNAVAMVIRGCSDFCSVTNFAQVIIIYYGVNTKVNTS